MNSVKKFYHYLSKIEEYLGLFLLVAMIVSVVLQVFSRYIMGKPFVWTEEASRFFFVWLIMFEMGYCIKKRAHIKVELFVDMMPAKVQLALNVIMKVLTMGFFVYLIPYSVQLAMAQHKIISTALQLPYSWIYGSVAIGSVLVLLHLIESLLFDTFPQRKED